ncbi:MAG: biopolymer transporter ExbD [Gammaproteobacteria bacterium]|nr:biopolymer transporter ExbD [Gammaproteobacteria bacterium]
MKLSRRAKRMQQHHARSKDRNAALNMVSLMDIFTILVFFLLVNATSSEVLPSPKNVTLPDSSAEKLPKRNLVIAVNDKEISLQGVPIVSVKAAMKSKDKTIKPLYAALKKSAIKVKDITDKKGVTIMGDKDIPYALLKKIMLTCSGAEFTNLSFAVNQKQSVAES